MKIKNLNIIRRIWNQRSAIGQHKLASQKEQIKEGNMEIHRVMVTVSDPHHTMQTQRKTKIMKRVKVKANDKDHAIDSALHHYKKAGYKVHDHEYLGRVHEQVEFVEAKWYNHNDNRTGFAKRHREDDEYHVPDPVHRQKHTIRMKLSKDGGPVQHKQMDVHTIHGAEHAKNFAHSKAKEQGWTVHEMTDVCKICGQTPCNCTSISEGAYGPFEKSEENKRSAFAAKKHGDNFAYHLHMADHHDNLAQWHSEKGRHGEADRHAQKSDEHHEAAMKLKEGYVPDRSGVLNKKDAATMGKLASLMAKEKAAKAANDAKKPVKEESELEEAIKIGSKVKVHAPGKDYHDQVGHVGEIRHGAFKGAAKTYTIDYADGKSVQLDKKNIKLHTEEVAANSVAGDGVAGLKGDAGKKAVMTKEPLKRQTLKQFKDMTK